jgi:hypothetical protein
MNGIDPVVLTVVPKLPALIVGLLDQARAGARPGTLPAVVLREIDTPTASVLVVGTLEFESWMRGDPQGGRPGGDGAERAPDENERGHGGVGDLTEGVYALPSGALVRLLEAPGSVAWELVSERGGHWYVRRDGNVYGCPRCMGRDEARVATFTIADLEPVSAGV